MSKCIVHRLSTNHYEPCCEQNILLQQSPPDPWWVKLADFGISKRIDSTTTAESELVGTQEYMAPELLSRPDDTSDVDYRKADMWAVGVMTFHMLTKSRGFLQRRLAIDRTPSPADLLPQHHGASQTAQSFILETTTVDPVTRSGWEGATQHAWIEHCIPSLPNLLDRLNLDNQ